MTRRQQQGHENKIEEMKSTTIKRSLANAFIKTFKHT